MELPRPSGIVTFLTDFGLTDPYAGVMTGMVKRQFARADVVTLTHGVPPQSITVGALFLRAAIDRFPPGTVHVVIVDPGVGTRRRLLAVHAHHCYWLGPDNGVLAPVLLEPGQAEVRQIDAVSLLQKPFCPTFHGRDILAPLAGMVASQKLGFRALGGRIEDPVRTALPDTDQVIHVDHFGNLLTNVTGERVQNAKGVSIRDRELKLVTTYGEAVPAEPVALINSYGLLEIAVRDGRADNLLAARPGEPVVLH